MPVVNVDAEPTIESVKKIYEAKLKKAELEKARLMLALKFYAEKKHINGLDNLVEDEGKPGWLTAANYDMYHDTEDGSVARATLYDFVKFP